MIRELPSAIRDIATLTFFGWSIYFFAHFFMGLA
jgi:hypothetical protein